MASKDSADKNLFETPDGRKIPKDIANAFRQRLTFLKNAKEHYRSGDFVNSAKNYRHYIKCVADYKEVDEEKLHPQHFDEVKEAPEMFLLTQTYWDLAKTYDRSDKFLKELIVVLNKYVDFSLGQRFQTANTQQIRKFIRKTPHRNKDKFQEAYKRLMSNKKGCYIATYCYGENHLYTQTLRLWRDQESSSSLKRGFIDFYYFLSPKLLGINDFLPIYLQNQLNKVFKTCIRVFLKLFTRDL